MLATTLKTFSDPATVIQYTRGAVSVPLVNAVYDGNSLSVDPNTGVSIMTKNPMIGVALADLPGGESRNGDVVTVTIGGVVSAYKVKEHQPDSEGHCRILLSKQ